MKVNLQRVYVVDDKDGNAHGFGPGEAEVPEWAVKKLRARGVEIPGASKRSKIQKVEAKEQSNG